MDMKNRMKTHRAERLRQAEAGDGRGRAAAGHHGRWGERAQIRRENHVVDGKIQLPEGINRPITKLRRIIVQNQERSSKPERKLVPCPYNANKHAAAMVGSKMVVFGGDSVHHLLDDTKILSLDKLKDDSLDILQSLEHAKF
ncbi:hypothetical protein GUJ93_ZPchr0003g18216 [Zizania palustris]|uniref:Uncharacterized protein n=1 Tax=Zizania palustris TaxID=103762 RepID=A0A8J5RWY7_ZIZPA|nr:hypothetical protein GUJ93_ZPchr0003g18216 [Zizania palustris]